MFSSIEMLGYYRTCLRDAVAVAYSSYATCSFGNACFNLFTPFLLTAVRRNSSFFSERHELRFASPSSVTDVWLSVSVSSLGRAASGFRPRHPRPCYRDSGTRDLEVSRGVHAVVADAGCSTG